MILCNTLFDPEGYLTLISKVLKTLIMLYTVRKVLASFVEFSNVDDVASCVAQQQMIFVTKRVVAAVDRVW